ncbi:MAG: hypothetical protein ACKV2U_09435 [Bryobacteraceae bacterium]
MNISKSRLIPTVLCLLAGPVYATPSFGFVSQTFRGRITENVGTHQWNPNPLFTVLIQSSNDQWGYDVVQGTTEFAPMDASGRPSQSGWHDHPTAISVAVVIQGTVWSHDAHNLNCLRPIPTGTVFTERAGEIHNNYNLDPRTPAIVRITHFVDRNLTATRRDQPDPVTGSTTAAAPPPAPCPTNAPAASSSPGVPAKPIAVAGGMNYSFPLPARHHSSPSAATHRRDRRDGTE